MKKQLLTLITLFTVIIGYSQTFTIDNIEYTVIPSTLNVEVSGYNTAGGLDVDIPNTVTNNATTYSVTIIQALAFQNDGLNSVIIPDSVTSIGVGAFINNALTSAVLGNNIISIGASAFTINQLTNITIPNSVLTIGNSAFQTNALTNLTIGNNVTSIGNSAFYDNALTSVAIPNSVTTIGFRAFLSNPLTDIISEATTPPTITTNNVTEDTFAIDRSGINLFIPTGTTNSYAASGWTGFSSVTEASPLAVGDTFVVDYITYEVTSLTPNTVKTTDYDIAGGTVVDIPNTVTNNATIYSVTSIGQTSFFNKGLTSVTLPTTITSIGAAAFLTNNLIDITIPDGVNVINISTFQNNLLSDVTIPNSVTYIGESAFKNNPLVTIISLAITPPTIFTGGGGDSFNSDRSGINLILTGNTTDEYVTDSGALWTGFKMVFEATSATTLKVTDYEVANGTAVSIPASITIPSVTTFNVTEIGNSAFFNKGITSITIPDSVTNIGSSAFEFNNLTDVTIPNNVSVIQTGAFGSNSIANLSLGDNVEIIGIGAFVNNNLTDITIPSNVTNIDLLAFGNNPLLASVTSLATVPPIIVTGTNDTFIFNRSNTALSIPAGTMGAYVTNPGALWTGFNPVTEDALSVSDFELENSIKVITTIDAIKVISPDSVRLEDYTIYCLSGAKVSTGTESEISTSFLASGIYVLKLDFDRGVVTKKVIIN